MTAEYLERAGRRFNCNDPAVAQPAKDLRSKRLYSNDSGWVKLPAMNVASHGPGFSIRHIAILLGVIAVLIRSLVAPGFMPDFAAAADGDFKLVICSSGELKQLAPNTGNGVPQNRHDGARGLCPFTALAHAATLADLVELGSEPVHPAIEQAPYRDAAVTPAVRGPDARAPPHFS